MPYTGNPSMPSKEAQHLFAAQIILGTLKSLDDNILATVIGQVSGPPGPQKYAE